MMGLIIWKCESKDLPFVRPSLNWSQIPNLDAPIGASDVTEKAKTELLQSLHNYFIQERKLFCYAPRLTKLMEIISAVEVRFSH